MPRLIDAVVLSESSVQKELYTKMLFFPHKYTLSFVHTLPINPSPPDNPVSCQSPKFFIKTSREHNALYWYKIMITQLYFIKCSRISLIISFNMVFVRRGAFYNNRSLKSKCICCKIFSVLRQSLYQGFYMIRKKISSSSRKLIYSPAAFDNARFPASERPAFFPVE